MATKLNIPMQNQPYRRQSSLGGNISYRNISANENCSYIVLAKVTKVYYKLGRLDYKLVNTVSVVAGQPGDGSGAAPIPVDFFGYQPNGKPYGHYRPVQTGDLIALAFVKGHQSEPIVIGVYPNNTDAYEILSPAIPSTGDDHKKSIAKTALSDQKIYPSGQMVYRSGSGEILKALNGHSYLAVSDEGLDSPNNFDQLWSTYDQVYDFYRGGSLIEPSDEKAGQWLLIHEDNPDADGADSHLTRFYVNKKGEFQIALMDNSFTGDTLMLTGSKNSGFTVTKYYDHPSKDDTSMPHGVGHNDDYQVPDFDNAKKYVRFILGDKAENISLEASSKESSIEQSSQLTVKSDGIYINGKLLAKGVNGSSDETIIDKSVSDALANSQELNNAIEQAQEAKKEAKQSGLQAIGVANRVDGDISDMKANMKYYLSISKDSKMGSKSDAWTKVFKDVYIEDEGALRLTASNIEAGILDADSITVRHLDLNEENGNHIQANIIDTGTLNAEVIRAKSIQASKIDSPELSDITKRLGNIEAGSISIGKIGSDGNAVDPTTTQSFNESIPFGAITYSQGSKHFSTIPASSWTGVKDHTLIVKVDVALQNYFNDKLDDIPTGDLPAGFRVTLNTASGPVVHNAPLDTTTYYNGENINTSISTSFRVPSDVIGGLIEVFGNIKVGMLTYGPVTFSYNDPSYNTAADAFSVDNKGNVIARSFSAPGGKITGGEISGGTIHADTTIDGAKVTATNIKGGTIDGTTITGTTIKGNTITGGTIDGTTITGTTITGKTKIIGNTIQGNTIQGSNISGGILLSYTHFEPGSRGTVIHDDGLTDIEDIKNSEYDWVMLSGNNLIWHSHPIMNFTQNSDYNSYSQEVSDYHGVTSVISTDLAVVHADDYGQGTVAYPINGMGFQSQRPIVMGVSSGLLNKHSNYFPDNGPQAILNGEKSPSYSDPSSTVGNLSIYNDGMLDHFYDGAIFVVGASGLDSLGMNPWVDDSKSSVYCYLNNGNNPNAGTFNIQKDNRAAFYLGVNAKDDEEYLGNDIRFATSGPHGKYSGKVQMDTNLLVGGKITTSNLVVNGTTTIKGGKQAGVDTSQGILAVSAYETAKTYFGDLGSATTGSDKKAIIGIDRIFNETVNTELEYQVFITPYSNARFWVEQRKPHYFVVESDQPNASFGWELKALRKGFENIRLENMTKEAS